MTVYLWHARKLMRLISLSVWFLHPAFIQCFALHVKFKENNRVISFCVFVRQMEFACSHVVCNWRPDGAGRTFWDSFPQTITLFYTFYSFFKCSSSSSIRFCCFCGFTIWLFWNVTLLLWSSVYGKFIYVTPYHTQRSLIVHTGKNRCIR